MRGLAEKLVERGQGKGLSEIEAVVLGGERASWR